MISILTVSTLFPNPAQPAHGAFVATRLKELVSSGEVRAEVLAPIPWKPAWLSRPLTPDNHLVPLARFEGPTLVHHPRYLVIPKVGMTVAPLTLYACIKHSIERLLREGRVIDLIDAHYFYPDGVAAVRAARHFKIPVCVTARGTDLNLIPEYTIPKKMIIQAAAQADGLITVCQALKDRLVELGTSSRRITVLRNGVNLTVFRPVDRANARLAYGLTRRTLVSVGLLVERKGHHLIIEALASMATTDLLIVGEGPDRPKLERLAKRFGVRDRVRFLGSVPQSELRNIYNAVDALVLASSREGWANVLLEAMACGTPVVASAVWGTPEVVTSSAAGVLMKSLDPVGVVEAVDELFSNYPGHSETRQYAEQFNWESTTQGQLKEFRRILAARQSKSAA